MTGLTDTQWLCIRPFLHACPGIYVDNETRCCLFVDAQCWMARSGASWRRLPPAYGKGNSVYRRLAHECKRGVWPRRMTYRQAKPELSAGRRDSTVGRARERGGRVPKQGAGSCPRVQPRRHQHQDPHRSTGTPPMSAPDGRPAPRPHPGPGPGRGLDRRAPPCLIADRAYDGDACRAWTRPLCLWARWPRSRARARPCCPTARRTDPDRPAGRPSGAARRPGRTIGIVTIDRVN